MLDFHYTDPTVEWITRNSSRIRENPDAWVIEGGEVWKYLRHRDGLYRLTETHRNSGEQFVMEAPDLETVERFLTCRFGYSMRSELRLPPIFGPYHKKDIRPGWTVSEIPSKQPVLRDPHGQLEWEINPAKLNELPSGWTVVTSPTSNWRLSDPSGSFRALFSDDSAIEYSWIANEPLELIRASYADPEGLPLFPEGWIGPPEHKPDHLKRQWDRYRDKNGNE